MNTFEEISDSELWALPFDSLMEILEQDAMKQVDGMSRDELNIVYDDVIEKRKKNCDIQKIAEQTDEENHECIKLSVLQNVVIDKAKEIRFAEDQPGLYQEIKRRNISFRDVEKMLSTPKIKNGELVNQLPSYDEVIVFIGRMLDEGDNKRYA